MPWPTSPVQPLCRTCGKPVKKRTHIIYFGRAGPASDFAGYRPDDFPRSRAEAQRLVNQQIVSLSWRRAPAPDDRFASGHKNFDYIDRVTVWDGETYEDLLFDTLQCAAILGRSVAHHHNMAMPAYHAALAKRKEPQA